jgi:hypothetical protein
MKIWRLMDPVDHNFAKAGLRGTWEPKGGQDVCPECTSTKQRRAKPLIFEWEPGSDVIGDFVWAGFAQDVAIKVHVFEELHQRFRGFEQGPVEMIQDPKLKKPTRITRRTKPRVWLPYEGPPLYDLWVTSWVHVDLQRTTANLVKDCSTCGYQQYEIFGIERRRTQYDTDRMELVWTVSPRVAGKGLFVNEVDLNGADIFRVHELAGCILCTDRVKRFIEDRELTNVTFLDYGDVISI